MSESQAVSIFYDNNSTRKGRIYLNGSASFCNTRFANLHTIYYVMQSEWPNYLFVDNSEFLNLDTGLSWVNDVWRQDNKVQQITDNKLMNCNKLRKIIYSNLEPITLPSIVLTK
eukprot:696365_1